MSDAPDFIWADPPETLDGMDVWRSDAGGKGIPYVRRDPAVLAALPEVQAMVAAAVLAENAKLREALSISGPIALADFANHPFILNNEEKRKVAVIRAMIPEVKP